MRIVLNKKHTVQHSILLICILFLECSALLGEVAIFENDAENFSNSGYLQLKWKNQSENNTDKTINYILEQGNSPDFSETETLYSGPEQASFISGLPNGEYYFRVAIEGADKAKNWSDPVQLTVKHHSVNITILLFSIGLTIFLATVALVIHGNRKHHVDL